MGLQEQFLYKLGVTERVRMRFEDTGLIWGLIAGRVSLRVGVTEKTNVRDEVWGYRMG